MKPYFYSILLILITFSCQKKIENTRLVFVLDENWKFINEEVERGEGIVLNTDNWKVVEVPHDWAISGEFDEQNDSQMVQVIEDGEEKPMLRTGRTGGLPHVGVGWYRKNLAINSSYKGKRIHLEFDGAMSNAKIYVNGKYVGEWPYGYASFGFDITDFINFNNEENVLAVRLENKSLSARWYPGAGLYRNVRMVITNPVHVKQWGTYITTPQITDNKGCIEITTNVLNATKSVKKVVVETVILSPEMIKVGKSSTELTLDSKGKLTQEIEVENPQLWNLDSTNLYTSITKIKDLDGRLLDNYKSTFGFREIEFTSDKGFFLNKKKVKLKGVCLHHDLGPLGAAINTSALRFRMQLLKDMGCNAIRTSHNPPTPELLDLADEMGFLMINEIFDEWKSPKNENGYAAIHWDKWAEKDLISFIHRDRNHPSVIMWSLGNEVREQQESNGAEITQWLHNISKREDPTRPTTIGMNHWEGAIKNGMAEVVDVQGWNYKPEYYRFIHVQHPNWKMYGSETASAISSRGEYYLSATIKRQYTRESLQCNAYETESVAWGHLADEEFAYQDKSNFIAGEFVWTGFDYLGEPTPYNDVWPSRSSYFGIIDLCGIPKDRYYLYKSKWSTEKVVHLLPHWNWENGDKVDVHCFTNYNKAELFLDGKSLGIKEKDTLNLLTTYRLVWEQVNFEPGTLKVVALNKDNTPIESTTITTAGEPTKIVLSADRNKIVADGKELVFITVTVVDENGNVCPKANNLINFSIEGEGEIRAVGNGNPTSVESFVKPFRKAFNGKCMLIVSSTLKKDTILVKATSEGLHSQTLQVKSN